MKSKSLNLLGWLLGLCLMVQLAFAPALLASDTQTGASQPPGVSTVELGKTRDGQPKTTLQYALTLPCEGWTTSAITLTGQMLNQADHSVALNATPLIDAGLLKEYGCQLRAGRILSRGQRRIIMEAYQFATNDGAFGAYCAVHRGSRSYLTQGDASSEDQDSICFCKNNYFIYLYSTAQDDDEAKATISQIATKLIGYIKSTVVDHLAAPQANALPEMFKRLPSFERVPGSEKLIMGPIGLRKFFPSPYSTILSPLTEGAVSDYKLDYPDRDRLKLLIVDYSSAEQAKSVYTNYVDTLRSNNKTKDIEASYYPTVLFKIKDTFLLCQLRNKAIIVISNARHKDSPEDLVHRIYF